MSDEEVLAGLVALAEQAGLRVRPVRAAGDAALLASSGVCPRAGRGGGGAGRRGSGLGPHRRAGRRAPRARGRLARGPLAAAGPPRPSLIPGARPGLGPAGPWPRPPRPLRAGCFPTPGRIRCLGPRGLARCELHRTKQPARACPSLGKRETRLTRPISLGSDGPRRGREQAKPRSPRVVAAPPESSGRRVFLFPARDRSGPAGGPPPCRP